MSFEYFSTLHQVFSYVKVLFGSDISWESLHWNIHLNNWVKFLCFIKLEMHLLVNLMAFLQNYIQSAVRFRLYIKEILRPFWPITFPGHIYGPLLFYWTDGYCSVGRSEKFAFNLSRIGSENRLPSHPTSSEIFELIFQSMAVYLSESVLWRTNPVSLPWLYGIWYHLYQYLSVLHGYSSHWTSSHHSSTRSSNISTSHLELFFSKFQ